MVGAPSFHTTDQVLAGTQLQGGLGAMVKQAVTKYLDSFLTQHALLYYLCWKEGVWGLPTGSRCVFE